MDWVAITCGTAAVYAAGRWLHGRVQGAQGRRGTEKRDRRGIPLKAVVANCEAKWFLEELQQAMSGDHAAMVRVSHMLLVGYGTQQDEAAAATWMRKAWALQNFKEPADPYLQYEMLDFQNSDIPVLNDPLQQPAAAAVEAASPSQPPAAAAAAAAAAHALQRQRQRRQQQRQRHSTAAADGATTAAAAAAEQPVDALQATPTEQAALDGGCSSSSSGGGGGGGGGGGSSGVQAGATDAAGVRQSSRATSRGGSRGSQQAALHVQQAGMQPAASDATIHQQQLLPQLQQLQELQQLSQATAAHVQQLQQPPGTPAMQHITDVTHAAQQPPAAAGEAAAESSRHHQQQQQPQPGWHVCHEQPVLLQTWAVQQVQLLSHVPVDPSCDGGVSGRQEAVHNCHADPCHMQPC